MTDYKYYKWSDNQQASLVNGVVKRFMNKTQGRHRFERVKIRDRMLAVLSDAIEKALAEEAEAKANLQADVDSPDY